MSFWTLPMVKRMLALSLFQREQGLNDRIEDLLKSGIKNAQDMDTLWFELECLVSYGEMLSEVGRFDEIREHLQGVIGRLTEGKEAKMYKRALTLLN